MPDQTLPCIETGPEAARLVHVVAASGLAALLEGLPPAQRDFVAGSGFHARAGELVLLPGPQGVEAALFGIGAGSGPHVFGALPFALPEGAWQFAAGPAYDADEAVLGFCLGAYRYTGFKPPKRPAARLKLAEAGAHRRALSQAGAVWMTRDLINAPANLLGPAELADAAVHLAQAHGAIWTRIDGAALERDYPTVAAVGRGSDRKPVVVTFTWRGRGAAEDAPLISLCGKGVCFDSGGYDLKPSAGMLRMKKDMGGAAAVLGMARMLMEADLPIRLAVRLGCVENSVSGHAMRPQDVIRTRSGLSVEIGNTDAEGRLVLCDLLHEASAEQPTVLLDCATLTGAARVAVGPDLSALFSNDDALAERLLAAGLQVHDPMWRLPLWDGYDSWLDSPVADLNNVASKPFAGAVVAALFLRRFVAPGVPWAHLDMYAYNDNTRPGRPEGGEAQALRAVFTMVEAMITSQRDALHST